MIQVTTNQDLDTNRRLVGKIPIANIFLLMLYASDLYRSLDKQQRASIDENPSEVVELLAEILTSAVKYRLLRKLNIGYESRRETLHRVRGRIDHLKTARHRLMSEGLIACQFDRLVVNTPPNRYVMSALSILSRSGHLRRENAKLSVSCRQLATRLRLIGIGEESVEWKEVASDRTGNHDFLDRLMLSAARLIHEISIPHEVEGGMWVRSLDFNEVTLRNLFESAVRNFYQVSLSSKGWRVEQRWHNWQLDAQSAGLKAVLPRMEFDIRLDNKRLNKRLIIDTKFTDVFVSRQTFDANEEDRLGLKSNYIYQVYTYVRSQERDDDRLSENAEGILLHPQVDGQVSEWGMIQNHRFRFETVDLTQSARGVHDRLLEIVES